MSLTSKALLVVTALLVACSGSLPDRDTWRSQSAAERGDAVSALTSTGILRVRRSWKALTASERRELVQGFADLKRMLSPWPYDSLCHGAWNPNDPITFNAYDYFVTAHINAFYFMKGMDQTMPMFDTPHMGPQFLPWHREYLRRMEYALKQALVTRFGTRYQNFSLPYWDWLDDPREIFSENDIGSANYASNAFIAAAGSTTTEAARTDPQPGSLAVVKANLASAACTLKTQTSAAEVKGLLSDLGFRVNVYTNVLVSGGDPFSGNSLVCTGGSVAPRIVRRTAACIAPLPNAAAVAGLSALTAYDAPDYNRLADEATSFRQNLEGFTDQDATPVCAAGGCRLHGQAHLWVGGEMSSGGGSPNDPIFFLHHANVDRLWALWQVQQCKAGSAVDACNPAFPAEAKATLFWFGQESTAANAPTVEGASQLSFCGDGYTYDTLERTYGTACPLPTN